MSPARRVPSSRRRLRRAACLLVCVLAGAQVAGWFQSDPMVGHFRTPEDQAAYRAAYAEALATMPTPSGVYDVATSFGVVRAYEWVNPGATGAPVVLLPGRGSGVPMWAENLSGLLAERTVFALDALGDAGLSAQTAPLSSMADQAEWVTETLAGLGIERAHIVGHSFGAATAAAFAVHHPERVATLTLLEPAFVLGWPPASVLGWSVIASLDVLPQSWRDTAVARIAGEDPAEIDPNDPVARMITLGGTGYSAELPTPRPLAREELRALGMPVHVALADGSPITGGAESVAKAEEIPRVQVKVWPGTSHSLPMQVAAPLAGELGAFWDTHDA